MKRAFALLVCATAAVATGGWVGAEKADTPRVGYAVFGEYARDANKLMHGDLNRRVFNVTEAHLGSDITLLSDGCIHLRPGTYRIQGFSLVTMQISLEPPVPVHGNYPGYAIVYPRQYEDQGQAVLQHAIAIGSPAASLDATPSFFDAIYDTRDKVDICVGHQAGSDLHDEVYLTVFNVDGVTSNFHVSARIVITRM